MFLLKNLRNRAFTLPELVVVIAIVAILSTAAFISYSSFNIDARDSVRKADMGNMKVILRSTKQKNGSYPTPTGITTSISR